MSEWDEANEEEDLDSLGEEPDSAAEWGMLKDRNSGPLNPMLIFCGVLLQYTQVYPNIHKTDATVYPNKNTS